MNVATRILDGPRHALLISCVRVEKTYGHDIVYIWNRGGKAGTLTVDKGDGMKLMEILIPQEMLDGIQHKS